MDQNKLKRRLDFNDMFFTGVSYMIGAGIFTLLPFIIKYGGKNAWLAFIIGGIISILTGLSFARLNYEYPVNLGNPNEEYTILEIANLIKAKTKSSSKLINLPLPEDDPSKRKPSIKLAKNLFNWQPRIDIHEGLQKTINHILSQVK